jgi:HEAT repeat protein
MHPFVESSVESFMRTISGPVFLKALSGLVTILNQNNPGDVFFLRKICTVLDSTAVLNMCKIMTFLDSHSSRDLLFDIVKMKSREDSELLDRMIENPDKLIVLMGISLLKTIKDNNSDYLLHKMLKHPEDDIRSSALDYFLDKPVTIVPRLFFLIDDPKMEIRQKLIRFIGSKRSISSETLLLNYLLSSNPGAHDKTHLMDCYKALGKCGSERSIPFLKKKVFDGAWTGLIGSKQMGERAEAILALSFLDNPEALKLIRKASESRSPLVSRAYRAILG